MKYLDEFIIGQENAKKVLSVACVFPLKFWQPGLTSRSVFNHYNRVRANLAAAEDQPDAQVWDPVNPSDGVFQRCRYSIRSFKRVFYSAV